MLNFCKANSKPRTLIYKLKVFYLGFSLELGILYHYVTIQLRDPNSKHQQKLIKLGA